MVRKKPEGERPEGGEPEKPLTAAEVLKIVQREIARAKQRPYKGVLSKKERGHG